jgi:F-type H+-transporting ATPase subunit b
MGARELIERERAEAYRAAAEQVAALAICAASKVVSANMDSERNRALVDDFLRDQIE